MVEQPGHTHNISAVAPGKEIMPVPDGRPSARSAATGEEGASAPHCGEAAEPTHSSQGSGSSEGAHDGSAPTAPAASPRRHRPHVFRRSAGASGSASGASKSGTGKSGTSKSGASKSGASTSSRRSNGSGSSFHLPSLGSLRQGDAAHHGGQQGLQGQHALRPYPLKPSMYEMHEKIGIGSSATVRRAPYSTSPPRRG